MLKFLRDLKEKKTNEMREMLEQMQEMRQRRIVEVWRALGDMPQAIRAAERRLQEGQENLLFARQKEEEILNGLSSNKQLTSWVRARKQCSNRMLQRALERAMRRAFAEKWDKWDWDDWEWTRNERGKEAESMRNEEWEKWKWGYVKWLMETNKVPEEEEEEIAQKRRVTNKEWDQERKRRERERQDLDQKELKELMAESELVMKQVQMARNDMQPVAELKHLEVELAVLQLALSWEQETMHPDLKDKAELLWLQSWHQLENWAERFVLVTMTAERDLLELQNSAQGVTDAKARLEKEHTRDEKGLQAATSDWQRMNHLADEWLSSDPTRDRLPLEGKESDHQQYLLEVILRNQSTFTAQSAYLDALLVFVSISFLGPNQGRH